MPDLKKYKNDLIKTLNVFSVFVLVSSLNISYALACYEVIKPLPEINVVTDVQEPEYNFSMTTEEMIIDASGSRDQWLIDHGLDPKQVHPHTPLITNGLSHPEFGIDYDSSLFFKRDVNSATLCPFFTNVTVKLSYSQRIIIPTEYPQGSCHYNSKLKHHQKYYLGDKRAVEKFAAKLEKDLPAILKDIETQYSQVQRTQLKTVYNRMEEAYESAANLYYDAMREDARKYRNKNESDESFEKLNKEIEECLNSSQ